MVVQSRHSIKIYRRQIPLYVLLTMNQCIVMVRESCRRLACRARVVVVVDATDILVELNKQKNRSITIPLNYNTSIK